MTYTKKEMMVIAAARMIQDQDILLCGTGLSMLAAVAAKQIYAPGATILFESGAVDPSLAHLPLAVSDSRVMTGATLFASLADIFCLMQNPKTAGRIKGIIGAAQIDPFGNLNSTMTGGYGRVTARFPGSGGACDIACLAGGYLVFMKLEKRRFVLNLDYLTSPGHRCRGRSRSELGLRPGGPMAVITDMGIFRFDPATGRLYLAEVYPGTDPCLIQEKIGFEVDLSRATRALEPEPWALDTLRTRTDPERLILE